MLLKKFFNISDRLVTGSTITFTIEINAMHEIFDGHFPGQPVVPGVCMLQIIKELLEREADTKLQLRKADHMKFLAVINPLENPIVLVEMSYDKQEDGALNTTARFYKDTKTFLKFRGNFVKV